MAGSIWQRSLFSFCIHVPIALLSKTLSPHFGLFTLYCMVVEQLALAQSNTNAPPQHKLDSSLSGPGKLIKISLAGHIGHVAMDL
jgi:hypothetical protein